MPASPAKVEARAPIAPAIAVISAEPRVMSSAFAFSPGPSRSPCGGEGHDVLQRPGELHAEDVVAAEDAERGDEKARLPSAITRGNADAISVPAGRPCATSAARFGPESTPICARRSPRGGSRSRGGSCRSRAPWWRG